MIAIPWSPIWPFNMTLSQERAPLAEMFTARSSTPMPVVVIKILSPLPRLTTLVSPVTNCTPASRAAAILQIAKLAPAIVTRGHVRRDEGERVLLLAAGLDGELTCIMHGNVFQRDLHNLRQGRWVAAQCLEKLLDRFVWALDFDRHSEEEFKMRPPNSSDCARL